MNHKREKDHTKIYMYHDFTLLYVLKPAVIVMEMQLECQINLNGFFGWVGGGLLFIINSDIIKSVIVYYTVLCVIFS